MKNRMQDVRDHLVQMMEKLNDEEVGEEIINRAKALSDVAQTYTNSVRVEIDARRLVGIENELPSVLDDSRLIGRS